MNRITKEDLIAFEKEVVTKFKEGNTYGPVHLSGGNEEPLLEIFKNIKPEDWVFSTHRSHYHALLKSKDRNWLMYEVIVNANSSHINSRKYKIFTSAIVGGIIPIALGTAFGIKLKKEKEHVWCFIGDMAAQMGCFWEAVKYAEGEDLPITFVIEDNSLGCNTPTYEVWKKAEILKSPKIIHYKYTRVYPHYGIGEFVIFKRKRIKSVGDYQAYKI